MIRFTLLGISLVLLVTGLVLLLGSVGRGVDSANAYLASHGGGMDTNQFMVLLQEYIHTYQWIGGLAAAIGGLGLIRSIEGRPGI